MGGSPHERDELREKARRLMLAESLRGTPFRRQRFEAIDLIVSTRPVDAGLFVSRPYRGEPFDLNHSRVIKGGWDHDHCAICCDRILPGDEWWAPAQPDQVGVCLTCHDEYLSEFQAPRLGELESSSNAHRRRHSERKAILTETQWSSSTVPRAMLLTLEERAKAGEFKRKLRLYACACVRRAWHLLEDERSRAAVEVAERYADGLDGPDELDAAGHEADHAASDLYVKDGLAAADEAKIAAENSDKGSAEVVFGERPEERTWHAAKAAAELTRRKVGVGDRRGWYEGGAWLAAKAGPRLVSDALADAAELRAREAPQRAALEALGAPLTATDVAAACAELKEREAAVDAGVESSRFYEEPWEAELLRCIFGNFFRPVVIDRAWISPKVLGLALAIYEERSFERLPELADALEEVGCDDSGLLGHCRRLGEHARGCWAVDAVLGKP